MAETWKQQLQRQANRLLHPLGLHLSRRRQAFTMEGILERSAARGFRPCTVIDVGASNGVWSLMARRHFPGARFVLFEPLKEHSGRLAGLQQRHDFIVVPKVAGAVEGTVAMHVDPLLDGSSVTEAAAPGTRMVPVTTVDAVVAEQALPGPFCLKLDTHGYEASVLAGARSVLQQTGLLIIEAYNFKLNSSCLRFHELCVRLEADGWRCCDLADPMRRPDDGAFWQMDLAFTKSSDPLFSRTTFR